MTVDRAVLPRCNIGPDELARRRRSAIATSAATAIIAMAFLALDVPGSGRLLLWPIATAAAVTWLQVVHRFCVAFGALGLQNFGRLGRAVAVDPAIKAADRRKALQIVIEGGVIGFVVALAFSALAI